MSDIATLPASSADLIGPGRLILVVGPSGAGKDTLIGLAQSARAGDDRIVFPRRVVTREASSFENNEAVSQMVFGQMLARSDFAFQWEAHGLRYGIPRSIIDDIRAGRTVIMNASRTIIDSARRSYANVRVIAVTAPADVLAQRVAARGRASDGRIEDRLRRAIVSAEPDFTINNVGSAEEHAAELLKVIDGI